MNNYYLTHNVPEEEKRLVQERHYRNFNKLQEMASDDSIPLQYQQRLNYELLSSLANCLLDDTILQIVVGLKEIQKEIEKSLYEKRMKTIGHLKACKLDLLKRNKESVRLRTMNQEQANKKESEFNKHMDDEIKKLDCKIIDELDCCLKEQQETLEKAGLPYFFKTDKQIEIRLQMYLLDFILRLD